jgi:hypothetical protein
MSKQHQGSTRTFTKARNTAAKTLQEFLEIDVSIVATLTDIAKGRFQRGALPGGEITRRRAEDGVSSIRHFLSTSSLLDAEVKASLSHRCDELEARLADLRSYR